jgi:hypothetical protein
MTLFRETYRKYGEKFYIKQIVILFFIGSRMFHNVVPAKQAGVSVNHAWAHAINASFARSLSDEADFRMAIDLEGPRMMVEMSLIVA